MLIPLRHENMRGRRWPVITFALIAANILVFLFTTGPIERQQPERTQTRVRLLIFAAMHPHLHMSPGAEAYVDGAQNKLGYQWDKAILANKELIGKVAPATATSTSAQTDDPALLQQQMDLLCQAFEAERKTDILDNYAFVPGAASLDFLHHR